MRSQSLLFAKNLLWCSLFSPLVFANAHENRWRSELFPTFVEQEKLLYHSQQLLEKGSFPLAFQNGSQCLQAQSAIKLNQPISLVPCDENPPAFRVFRSGNYTAQLDLRSGTPTLRLSVEQVAEKPKTCPRWDGQAVEIEVKNTFSEGDLVRDFYSGDTATVRNGKVTFTPDKNANGLILLEKVENRPLVTPFDWRNATVYFVITDRFANGNTENDHSYGRQKDGMDEIGTFHGGDLVGLTQKLDYLQALGVNVLWISSPLEQIHGWVGGGDKGDFPHYAYHGYYHQDWTKVDANMGTERELQQLIEQAHKRGIRVIFDIVMNHTGYATLADMQEFGFGSLYLKGAEIEQTLGKKWTNWQPKAGQNWHSFNNFINFSDKENWTKWWGKDWVRSDLGDYDSPKFDDLKMSLSALPDLKTESEQAVKLPAFFANKATHATEQAGYKVRDYLISWLTDWVKKYGVDGFRVDTAKHVEKSTWLELKNSAEKALKTWQVAHPTQDFQDNFWLVGEAWGHTVVKSDYFQNGFDAMINFDFQDQAKASLACFADIEPIYQKMSEKFKNFNMLSYLSSHDTRLFFHSDSEGDFAKQKTAANLLLLAPGAVQLFYGDESGRKFGVTGSDPVQGTRSDMNWVDLVQSTPSQQLHLHWQKLANFRKNHTAIGKGTHHLLSTERYFAFSRHDKNDNVMVVWVGKTE